MSKTALTRKVRRAQYRLWINGWLRTSTWSALVGASAWSLAFLVERLFGFGLPLGIVALLLGGLVLVVGTVSAFLRREDRLTAAITLDKNAGLKERLSSGVYCAEQDDGFSHVVVHDADETARTVKVARAVPLRWPRPASWLAVPAVVAVIVWLIPPQDLLGTQEDPQAKKQRLAEQQAKERVLKVTRAKIKQRTRKNPDLKDLDQALEEAKQLEDAKELDPDAMTREKIKELQQLKKAVADKKEQDKYEENRQLKKLFKQLTEPEGKSPTEKLQRALARGDFGEAAKILKQMKKQLALRKSDPNDPKSKQLQSQLDKLARQLKHLSKTPRLDKKLAKAGLNKEQIEKLKKLLEQGKPAQAKKLAAKQVRKLSQKQLDKLMKDLKRQTAAGRQCRGLGQKLGQAAAAMGQGGDSMQQEQEAADALGDAADQLSEAEMINESLKEMEAMLAELDEAKDRMTGSVCGQCNGTGLCNGKKCSACGGMGVCPWKPGDPRNRPGSGMGGPGQGRGADAPKQEAAFKLKKRRAPVVTKGGQSIGSYLVDGVQVKGQARKELAEVLQSARQEAEDAINNEEIPKRYQGAVKRYFSDVARKVESGNSTADK